VLLVFWFIVILAASVMPAKGPETKLPLDKIVHAFMYGVTAVFLCRRLLLTMSKRRALLSSVLAASAYGAIMECIQYFLPYRSFSPGDMAANTAGALIFSLLYIALPLPGRQRE